MGDTVDGAHPVRRGAVHARRASSSSARPRARPAPFGRVHAGGGAAPGRHTRPGSTRSWPRPRTASPNRSSSRASSPALPGRRRGDHRRRGGQAAVDRRAVRASSSSDRPPGVRRHRPPRGRVRHLEHVLDPGRPAHAGAGAAAGGRRQPRPGARARCCSRPAWSASSRRCIGMLAGIGLAQAVTAAFEASGADLPADGLAVRPATVVIAFAVGIGVTLVAALIPAIRSMRVPPLAALRDVAVDRSGASTHPGRSSAWSSSLGALEPVGRVARPQGHRRPATGRASARSSSSSPRSCIGPVLAGPSIRLLGRRCRGSRASPAGSPRRTRPAARSAPRPPHRPCSSASPSSGSSPCSPRRPRRRSARRSPAGFVGDFVVQSESASSARRRASPRRRRDGLPGPRRGAGSGSASPAPSSPAPTATRRQFLSAVDPAGWGGGRPRMAGGAVDRTSPTTASSSTSARPRTTTRAGRRAHDHRCPRAAPRTRGHRDQRRGEPPRLLHDHQRLAAARAAARRLARVRHRSRTARTRTRSCAAIEDAISGYPSLEVSTATASSATSPSRSPSSSRSST